MLLQYTYIPDPISADDYDRLIIYLAATYSDLSIMSVSMIYYETNAQKKSKTNMSKIISRSRTINYVVVTFQSF